MLCRVRGGRNDVEILDGVVEPALQMIIVFSADPFSLLIFTARLLTFETFLSVPQLFLAEDSQLLMDSQSSSKGISHPESRFGESSLRYEKCKERALNEMACSG
jgi:hypothetical protein